MRISSMDRARVGFRLALVGLFATGLALLGAERAAGGSGKQHRLVPALQVARSSQAALRNVSDYEATFNKREWIDDELQAQSMKIKLRQQPFSVYLRFIKPHEGREVIYNAGRNDGKLQVHLTGLKSIIGTVSLLPTSSDAMEECRYPVTMIGLSNLIAKVIDQWEAELKYDDVNVTYYPDAKLGGRQCKVIQSSHARRRPGVEFQMTRLYIDKTTNLPVRVEQFGFPEEAGEESPLLEEYTYSNIKTNVGLKEVDFDIENPSYDF